jgi:hypothetical protein
MMGFTHFATLLITTVFAGATAVFFNWVLLEGAFHLMRPATARRIPRRGELVPKDELVHGTAQLVRAFAAHR